MFQHFYFSFPIQFSCMNLLPSNISCSARFLCKGKKDYILYGKKTKKFCCRFQRRKSASLNINFPLLAKNQGSINLIQCIYGYFGERHVRVTINPPTCIKLIASLTCPLPIINDNLEYNRLSQLHSIQFPQDSNNIWLIFELQLKLILHV